MNFGFWVQKKRGTTMTAISRMNLVVLGYLYLVPIICLGFLGRLRLSPIDIFVNVFPDTFRAFCGDFCDCQHPIFEPNKAKVARGYEIAGS